MLIVQLHLQNWRQQSEWGVPRELGITATCGCGKPVLGRHPNPHPNGKCRQASEAWSFEYDNSSPSPRDDTPSPVPREKRRRIGRAGRCESYSHIHFDDWDAASLADLRSNPPDSHGLPDQFDLNITPIEGECPHAADLLDPDFTYTMSGEYDPEHRELKRRCRKSPLLLIK